MTAMLNDEVMPRLRRLAGEAAILRSRLLRTWGVGESRIAEALDDLFGSANPSIAYLISDMEVKIRISAKAADAAAADRLLAPVESEIRARLGDAVFGSDDETVETLVVEGLAANGWMVATVEAATLGQVGARIALAREDVFAGSVVASGQPPPAEVLLTVGPIGPDLDQGTRTTRQVEMTVVTPIRERTRVFDFGGDDERVRSFATIAGLHLIRLAVEPAR
jgi:nicotinamide-nucleotide amidase